MRGTRRSARVWARIAGLACSRKKRARSDALHRRCRVFIQSNNGHSLTQIALGAGMPEARGIVREATRHGYPLKRDALELVAGSLRPARTAQSVARDVPRLARRVLSLAVRGSERRARGSEARLQGSECRARRSEARAPGSEPCDARLRALRAGLGGPFARFRTSRVTFRGPCERVERPRVRP